MILYADEHIASEMEVLNLDTGEFIKHCLWANQEDGTYCVFDSASLNHTIVDFGNIVLVYKGE